jgi:hypothetical protein
MLLAKLVTVRKLIISYLKKYIQKSLKICLEIKNPQTDSDEIDNHRPTFVMDNICPGFY